MAEDCFRDTDATNVRDLLEPHGDINCVTASIFAFYDDIADVGKPSATSFWRNAPSCGKESFGLHRHRLCKQTPRGALEEPSVYHQTRRADDSEQC